MTCGLICKLFCVCIAAMLLYVCFPTGVTSRLQRYLSKQKGKAQENLYSISRCVGEKESKNAVLENRIDENWTKKDHRKYLKILADASIPVKELPNILIIGAKKSGTSKWFLCLHNNPNSALY